jgi:phosphoribosylformylglycinamidine cyclo-ligase
MLDYIAVQQAPDPAISEEIAQGLLTGAQIAKISIPGGETAQLPDIIKGEAGGYGMDLVGTCVGLVDVDKVIVGREIAAGDVIIGLRSSGIHSNGLTLARRVLFERLGYKVDTYVPEVGRVLGEELLEPTRIYVQDVLPLVKSDIAVTGLVNITSDGFLNLTRLYSDVGFKIDSLPEPQAIFKLIQDGGDISNEEMFHVYNMGIGFCVIVRPNDADRALDLLKGQNAEAQRLGSVIPGPERRVLIEPVGLVGMNGRFHSI